MTKYISFLLLMLSFGLSAQSKLIVFSEKPTPFSATINNVITGKEGNKFFEFDTSNLKTVLLNIKLQNNIQLTKLVNQEVDKTSVYAIVIEDNKYKLRFRGNYNINEDIPNFGFIVQETKKNSGNLIQLNTLIGELDNNHNEVEKKVLIINTLQMGTFNCRQLEFLFKKLKSDESRIEIFEKVNHNCLDIKNFAVLFKTLNRKSSRNSFTKIIYSK